MKGAEEQMKKIIAWMTGLLMVLSCCVALAEGTVDVDVNVTYGQTEARGMLAMINAFRTGTDAWYYNPDNTIYECTGLQELVYDYDLERAAMQRAAEIAVHFAHTRPNNESTFTAFPSGVSRMGENIAAGYATAAAAFTGWREDEEPYSGQGHRRNMLGSGFNCIGIGHVVYNGYHFWTHALGYRSSPNTSATTAQNSAATVTVSVSPALVKSVSAGDLSMQFGESGPLPSVSFTMTETWPSRDIPYAPHSSAGIPAWIASEDGAVQIGGGGITAVKAGSFTLSANVLGKSVTAGLRVSPKSISGATAALADASLKPVYNGLAWKPEVMVKDGDKALTKDTDYTVSWRNNKGATDAAIITVTGKGNYTDTAEITFAIAKAPLTVTAADQTIVYGDAPNGAGVSYAGFVNGENESVLGGKLSYTSDYDQFDNIGTGFSITPAGLSSDNYEISYVSGSLTVTQKEVGLRWGSTQLGYTGSAQVPKVTVTGTVNGDKIGAEVSGAQTELGSYIATVTGLTGKKAGNYSLPAEVSIAFEIVEFPSSVTNSTGTYTIEAGGTATFSKPAKSASALTIPDTIPVLGSPMKVTAIADNALKGNKKLTTVKIGKNIQTIGKNAFANCAKLKTVKGGGAVTVMKDGAFSGCKALKTFPTMNRLQKIGANAFKGAKALAKFTLAKTVTSIGKNAFNGCAGLKTITVKAEKLTNKNVGAGAFKGISQKATFKCPKKQLKNYKKLFVKKGAPKTCKFK